MKFKKRLVALTLAACLIFTSFTPLALATDFSTSQAPDVTQATSGASSASETSPTPEATTAPMPAETPVAGPESASSPEPSPEPKASPADSQPPQTSPQPTETTEPTTEPVEITEMFTTAEAEPGDVVELYVTVNRQAGVSYQWERLYTPPLNAAAADKAIYPYGEGESTDYYFPLEGMSEAEALALNPNAVWPGIEMYYDQLSRQPMTLDENAAAPEIHIENGTHNYILEPEEPASAEEAPLGEWTMLEGETSSTYRHEVTAQDEYSSYRCIVTVGATAPQVSPEPETSTAPQEGNAPTATKSPANEALMTDGKFADRTQKSASAPLQTQETSSQANVLTSDSMYIILPEQDELEPSDTSRLLRTVVAAPAVALSDDHQWLTGLDKTMEYITKSTYEGQSCETAGNTYWTRINGGARPDGTKYSSTPLIDGKMEVLSAWYGKTVYVRYQGQSGPGTTVEIPAYTGIDYQTGKATLYKNAIKVFNAWVPDTGASFYATYLNTALSNGNTPNGGHVTVVHYSIETFNKIPRSYLTNAEGDYIYDAVIVGAATNAEPDLSGAAAWELARYIGEGYGFLIGHDMLYGYGGVASNPDYTPDPNSTVTPYYKANTLENGHYNMAWLMGQNARYTDTSPYSAPSMILCGGDYRNKSTLYGDDSGMSKLRILKSSGGNPITNVQSRTPTNYPYSTFHDGTPFKVNNTLDATATHTNQQVAYGTIWLNYASNGLANRGLGQLINDVKSDGLVGTNNFYLASNGNLAMSQIGHKRGNKDSARIDECYILANTLFYISQRQQCQVCQSHQGGNDNTHFVRRISSAEELAKLADQDKYWFTYPLDGCYILTADIHLPESWQPIQGFTGHFDADGHSITFSHELEDENRTVFAPAEDGGWNLGTDKTQGVLPVYQGDTRSTGVARVVGYISALGVDAGTLEGYTVEITGTDGTVYTCLTNRDGKYVVSNLPCTGVMPATLYDPTGRRMDELGQLAVTIPDGTGMVTPEGRNQDFWLSSETTAIYPLDYLALPPDPISRWVSESGSFTATILTSNAYPEDKIIWQYKAPGQEWADLKDSSVEYQVEYLGQVDTGDPLTTGTQTRLTLHNLPLALDGAEVRIRYTGNRDAEKESGSAAVTVRKPELKLDMSTEQTVFVRYEDQIGNRLNYAVPADRWPALFGESYPAEYGALNNGSNVAEYTSTILYRPELDERSTPTLQWLYRTGNNTTTETALGSSQYDESSHTWTTNLDYAVLTALYPELTFELTNSEPMTCTEDGTPDPDGEWRKVTSTLAVDGAATGMDVGNTHFFFRCTASNEYGSGQSYYQGKASSADAGLNVQYTLDILPGEGLPVYGSGYADWTFPDLQVFAPNGLRMAILTFFQPGHSGNNKITVTAGNPYGITADAISGDYVVFKSASGELIPQETWQEFFRQYLTFRSYDPKDAAAEDVSWYIDEEDESDKFKVMLFDGTTDGWTGNAEPYAPRPYYGYGSPSDWSGYNRTVTYKGMTASNSGLSAVTTSGSDQKSYWSQKGYYYNFRGWNATLSKSFDATNLSKLYLDAYITSPSSSIIYNSIMLTGNGSLTISNPGTGKVQTTTNGLQLYDISSITGLVSLTLNSNVATGYAIPNDNLNGNFVGLTETTTFVVRQAYALSSDFERGNRSAVRYSELWANAVKTVATVTLVADPEKVYNGLPSKATLTVTAADGNNAYIYNNATLTYTKAGQLISTGKPGAASGCIDQGTYTATATFPQEILDRYTLTGLGADGSVKAQFTITPRPLTLRSKYLDDPDAPANIKMYDGTTAATIGNIKVANIVPGDPVALDKTSYTGSYTTAAAGEQLTPEGKVLPDRYKQLTENTITRTEDIKLTNDPKGNYYIAAEDYSGAIYRRPVTAFVGAFTSIYGEDPQLDPHAAAVYSASEGGDGFDLEISALVGGDTLTINPAKSHFILPTVDATSPAGVYEVAYDGLTEANYPVLTNYILWQQPGQLTIGPRPLTVNAGDYTKVYGDPLPTFQAQYTGLVNGDTWQMALDGSPVFATSATSTSSVGDYPVRFEADCLMAKSNANGYYNYEPELIDGTLTVTARPITVTADAKTKVYGDTDPELTYQLSEALVDENDLAVVLERVSGEDVGTYQIKAPKLESTNYDVTYVPADFTITPAILVARAEAKSKVYGDPLPELTAPVTGWQFKDTLQTATNNDLQITTDAQSDSDVGTYTITPHDLTLPKNSQGFENYIVKYVTAPLEITKRPIIITPDGPDPDPDAPEPGKVSNVTITKTANKTVLAVGDTVTYTLTVTNTGTVELTNLPVRDTHDGAGSIEAQDGPGYTYADGAFTVLRLPVGKSITITYRYTALEADAGKTITNLAVAAVPGTNPEDPDNPGHGIDPGQPIDPDKEVPSNEVEVPVDPDKDPEPDPEPVDGRSVQVTKTSDLAFAKPGDTITYTMAVTNTGTEDLANVVVRDRPLNFAGTPQAVPGTGYTCQDNVCTISNLPVGGSVTLTYTYQVQEADAGRNLRNLAVATIPGTNPPDPADPDQGTDPTKPIDPDQEVPSNEIVVPVDPTGGLAADPKIKVYGDPDPELTYTLPEGLIKPSDIWGKLERVPGEDVGTYTITQGTVQSTNYDITFVPSRLIVVPAILVARAEAKSKVYGDPLPELTAPVTGWQFKDTLQTATNNDLQITTDAQPDSDVGTYTITPHDLTLPKNSQGLENYIVKYVTAPLEITKRPIIITPDGPDTDPDAPEPGKVSNATIAKTADKTVLAVGDTVTYTLTVTNTGTVELTNLPVRDTHDGAGSIQAQDGPGYTYADGVFTVLRLPVGKNITITYRYTALAADAGKTITNLAVATVPGANPEDPDNPGHGVDPDQPIDPAKEVPSNEVEVPVDPDKDPEPDPEPVNGRSVQVTKISDLAFAKPGDTITYFVQVKNTGTEDLADVVVRDKPLNFAGTPQAVPGTGYACQDNVCTISSLLVGGSVTLTYTYQVQEADAGRNLRNLAVATIPGTNPPDPSDPDQGTDPTKPIDPDKEVPSNEIVVPVDPTGGLAADPKIKVYGDPDPELTYTLPEGLIKPSDIWGKLERVPGEDVGTYTILQGTVQSTNYDITFVPSYLLIVPAPLIITATDKERPAYAENPPFTVTYEGFKFEDGPGALDGELLIDCPADIASEPGTYPITPCGLFGHNYTITYVPGTLTIWGIANPPNYGWIKIYPPEAQSWYGTDTKPFPQTGSTAFATGAKLGIANVAQEQQTITGELDFGYTMAEPSAPATKELTYIDANGEVATVTGRLIAVNQIEGYGWRDIDILARWYGDEDKEGFMLGDTAVPYTKSTPIWGNYEAMIRDHLELDPTQWRIVAGMWTDDWTYDENSLSMRPAVYKAQFRAAHWVATYSAVIPNDGQPIPTPDAREHSTVNSSSSKTAYLAVGAIALCLILFLFFLFFWLLKKRKKEQENEKPSNSQ